MLKLAGIAQFPERRSSLPEAAGEIPAPRSTTLAQALAEGLQLDPIAWEAGRVDGAAGARWWPGKNEILAYASGYMEGEHHRPKKSGGST